MAKNEKILVSRSLSKSYGLAGLRFGYLLGQPQVVEQLIKVKDSYNCDALSIAAATAAIDDQVWLADNRRKIVATRSRLEAGLKELGFEVIRSQANFVWCTHAKQAARSLYERLKAAHVLVRYMNYSGYGDGLRVTKTDFWTPWHHYTWGLGGVLLDTNDSQPPGAPLNTVVYTPGVSQNVNGTDSFFHTDWLGFLIRLRSAVGGEN